VFERFSQASGQSGRQGLGLGLAIVKHLVGAHEGDIRVESAGRGRGTTFVVDWPLCDASSSEHSANATSVGSSDDLVLH
jgi:signal transduction histidine kinase